MSQGKITLSNLRQNSEIKDDNVCEEDGCSVRLDRMPDRAVFHPDDIPSSNPRADCCIFFPDESKGSTNQLYRNKDSNDSSVVTNLALIELKNTIEKPEHIKTQIEGAIDFAVDLLKECSDPPWNISWICAVAHNNRNMYNKSIKNKKIKRHIGGDLYIFRLVPIDSDQSLRDIFESDEYEDTIRVL